MLSHSSLFVTLHDDISPRKDRMQKRCDDDDDVDSYQGIQNDIEVAEEQNEISDKDGEGEVQCELPIEESYSIKFFKDNPKAVSYYTGFSSYNHFIFMFYCFRPAVFDLIQKCAARQPTDQIFF